MRRLAGDTHAKSSVGRWDRASRSYEWGSGRGGGHFVRPARRAACGRHNARRCWIPCSGSFPRGLEDCPLPDFIVVHFPDYAGPPCFEDLPGTWVPIPCVEVRHKNNTSGMVRVGIPLQLAWALTIHKSQGINATDGCVVSWRGRAHNAGREWERLLRTRLPWISPICGPCLRFLA